ncbi:MAG: thioesterase [bacterium]|jgi:acyl-ACP thioesterase|nr:thioesterase [bacterium]
MMKFQQAFTVRIYECKADGKLKVSALLDYMQEIAGLHTIELKITIPDLFPRGLTWMLSRYHIVIDRAPVYGDTVSMQTWVSEHCGMFSIREYRLSDTAGQSLARATSSWVLYDIHQKKTVAVAEALPLDVLLPERAVKDDFASLPLPERCDSEQRIRVRMHDLDINRHVNNRFIAEWALEAVDPGLIREHTLRSMEISFKGQAFYGDSILSRCKIEEDRGQLQILHHLITEEKQRSIALLRSRWEGTKD